MGLKGDQIPLMGRIVAIADVFDALMCERPYKPAFSLGKSLQIMLAERGQHFDPHLLDCFMARQHEVLQIMTQYAEERGPQGM